MKILKILALCIFILGCRDKRTPEIHNIPEDYIGHLIIVYDESGYPELKKENGYIHFNYPPTGIIITSSKQEYGWASDKYFIVKSNADNQEIETYGSPTGISIFGGGSTGSTVENREYSYSSFFIGIQKDFEEGFGDNKPKLDRIIEELEKRE